MRDLTKQGKSIIMVSSEMPELIGMSDRIIVMASGSLMGILNKSEADQEKIMQLASLKKAEGE
jgi:ABC-type sugar transport system ATPase subunit